MKEFEEYCLPLCPSNCRTKIIDKTLYTGLYPTTSEYNTRVNRNAYLRSLRNTTSDDNIKKSLAYIRVYYDDLQYTYMNQLPKLIFVDLISSIGGTLGLCLGMSFLSFFEALEIIYLLIKK